MKKLISCAVASSVFLLPASAFADISGAKMIGNTCVVSGEAEKGETVSILVTNDSFNEDIGNAITFTDFKAETSGEFSVSMNMKQERIGETDYVTVLARVGDGELWTKALTYVSEEELNRVTALLKSADSAEAIKEIIEADENKDALSGLGFDRELWEKADKNNASAVIYDNRACFDGEYSEIEKTFTLALALSSSEDMEKMLNLIENISPIETNGYTWKEIKEDAVKSAYVLSYIKENVPYDSKETLDDALLYGALLAEMKQADSIGDLRDVLVKSESLMNFASQDWYSKYSSNKEGAAKYLLDLLAKTDEVTSYEQFSTLMQSAVDLIPVYSSGNSNSSNSSGGGGGGGGSSASSFPVAPAVTTVTVESEANLPQTFPDMPSSHWAYKAVEELAEKKIINGYEDGTFAPDKKVTREEFVTMLINALEIQTTGGITPFADVKSGLWYSPYVSTAYQQGLVSGISKSEFGLGYNITREDIAAILSRVRSEYPEKLREYEAFSDDAQISDYAKQAVVTMYEQGVISGDNGFFNPKNSASRAETAMMIYKFINLGGQL